jgi:hypothetical protein
LTDLADDIAEPETLERLLEREREGKNRKTAVSALEERLEEAEPLTEDEMVVTEPSAKSAGGNLVNELLVSVLESPQRVSVYLTVQTLGSGTPETIAGRMVLSEDTVRSTLEDFESEGIAEQNADGQYSVASPITVLQKRQNTLWSALQRSL